MSIHPARTLAAGSATLALLLAAAPANAITRNIGLQQNASGACQVTMSVYESVMRKRPLAMQNEGTSAAFVTCSPATLKGITANDTLGYNIRLINLGNTVADVNCTAVVGSQGVIGPVYVTRSTNVVGSSCAVVTFRTFDGYTTTVPFNFQCLLPPGTGISTIELNQNLDVGA